MIYGTLRPYILPLLCALLCSCASSSGGEKDCAQKFRASAEGIALDRCLNAGGIAVFQGESATFTDCRFKPDAEKPRNKFFSPDDNSR